MYGTLGSCACSACFTCSMQVLVGLSQLRALKRVKGLLYRVRGNRFVLFGLILKDGHGGRNLKKRVYDRHYSTQWPWHYTCLTTGVISSLHGPRLGMLWFSSILGLFVEINAVASNQTRTNTANNSITPIDVVAGGFHRTLKCSKTTVCRVRSDSFKSSIAAKCQVALLYH